MAKNRLIVNEPRIGWYYDGLPDKVTPPTATMLLDDGQEITLTLPWRISTSPGQAERWFAGSGTPFGDDPGRIKYSYELPPVLTFRDVDGSVALVGCRTAGYRQVYAQNSAGQGRVQVQLAVLGTFSSRWSKVNAVRTVIPELSEWFGLTSVDEQLQRGEDGRLRHIRLTLATAEPLKLASRLNLHLRPLWRVEQDPYGPRQVYDEFAVETRSTRPRSWQDHFAAQQAVRELLDLAGWEPFGYARVTASRDDDPRRVMSGEAVDVKWCDVRSYGYRAARLGGAHPRYLFRYPDIGLAGFRRWLRLRKRFERGVGPMMALLDLTQIFVDTQLVQSSAALEAIGYQLALDGGSTPKAAGSLPLVERLRLIERVLPVPPVLPDWPQQTADAYNGVKHADRALPNSIDMWNAAQQNILAFRTWAATRLGVSAAVLATTVRTDPMYINLQQQRHTPQAAQI